MAWRERVAIHLSPLPLRVALAATFIWVGLGKIMAYESVSGVDAADLATMGILPAGGAAAPALEPPRPQTPAPTGPPATTTPSSPQSPATQPSTTPAAPSTTPSAPPPALPKGKASWLDSTFAPEARILLASQSALPAQGSTATVRRMYPGIALRVYRAAGNGLERAASGANQMASWPGALGSGNWPKYQAWAVSLIELIGGIFLLVGLATRFASILLVGVMLGAVWLTQIGPAIASGQTTLGFLPNHNAYDVQAWMPFFWQLALLGGCLSLLLAGPGSLSLDRWLGASPRDHDGDDDEIDA